MRKFFVYFFICFGYVYVSQTIFDVFMYYVNLMIFDVKNAEIFCLFFDLLWLCVCKSDDF